MPGAQQRSMTSFFAPKTTPPKAPSTRGTKGAMSETSAPINSSKRASPDDSSSSDALEGAGAKCGAGGDDKAIAAKRPKVNNAGVMFGGSIFRRCLQ